MAHSASLAASTPGPVARRRWDGVRNALPGYLFLAPWLAGFVLFTLGPTLVSLYLSFTDFDLLRAPQWVGAANYQRMFSSDPKFWASVSVTLTYVVLSVPLKLAFALAVAMVLDRGIRGLSIYRAIFYLPSLLGGSVAVAILWKQVFGYEGLVNEFLWFAFGINGPSWISNPATSLYTLVLLSVWQFGSPMIIFLAGLRQIPRDLYEAASIDGATRRQQLTRITLPLLAPVIFFNLVLQTIEAFKAFTPAFIISGGTGGPVDSTLFYTLYLYQQGFAYFRMGYASALAWVLLLTIAAFTALTFFSQRFWVYYEDDQR
ncbi:carbohydrate ABC transporter permease [Bosea sp. 2KB_26]|uniref:carbohydrate ABC transporter permease n=1 Tax=Bosea sp. 2KB_26 TaxID=3237475 RepID=UPI003F93A96B